MFNQIAADKEELVDNLNRTKESNFTLQEDGKILEVDSEGETFIWEATPIEERGDKTVFQMSC